MASQRSLVIAACFLSSPELLNNDRLVELAPGLSRASS